MPGIAKLLTIARIEASQPLRKHSTDLKTLYAQGMQPESRKPQPGNFPRQMLLKN